MTRRLIFTVDVDRDANLSIEGGNAAGSMDRGNGTDPRFSSSERGLGLLLELLDDLGIKGTFFIEGRTSEVIDCSGIWGHCVGFHGYDHEDLTSMSDPGAHMRRGFQAVRDNVSEPVCFRAPFMKVNDGIIQELVTLGIGHDSSVYADPGTLPYPSNGVMEHPVAKGRDGSGKTIAAYLWPMHEGRRFPADYSSMITGEKDQDLVISTHSWHIVEGYDSGLMSKEDVVSNLNNVREVLELFLDRGFIPSTITG